jgi:predicted ATPase/class 3 adenylate cyclase
MDAPVCADAVGCGGCPVLLTHQLVSVEVMSVGLPSGMVTFVFTDLEGSTQLFRRIGDRYPPVLERHRELLRSVWQAHGGHELITDGDSFFLAFADAADALGACAQAQRVLADEPWPTDAVVRVRMGVHTGLAAPRGDGYVAFAVHQAARIADAANGGQVVVSATTASRIGEPSDLGLVSLGRFRVRDFDDPVELFRLDIDGVAPVDTALRALPAERHNLLRPFTELVGRDHDLATLAQLVAEHRLVTVVGAGGLGKTRLAVEYALRHASDWPHGVWFADLTRTDEPTGIATVLAEAVGAPVGHDREVWDATVDHLGDRHTVVVLDNCEHLGVDVALRAAELLSSCPGVRVVATSREPLGLRGERVWRPPALGLQASVELFCRLAGLVDPDPAICDTVETLCGRVDRLPLAIELAAARADLLTPSEIIAGLDAGLGLGTSRDPTLDQRQRSLEELIAWSYDLLSADEQRLFRSLGVFEAGFEVETATAAAAHHGLEASAVDELMRSLLDKSLVVADPTAGSTRHRLQVTIRSYARRLLGTCDELIGSASGLAHHYLRSFGPQFEGSGAERAVYRRRALEVDNLRHLIAAMAHIDQPVASTLAVVVVDSTVLTSRRHALTIGRSLLAQLDEPCPERVALLDRVSGAASGCGDLTLAHELTRQALSLREAVGEPSWLDGALDEARAVHALYESDPETALAIARAGLATAATAQGTARLQGTIGCASLELGDLDAAQAAFELELQHYAEATAWRSVALGNLADVALRRGDVGRAASLQREALDISVAVGHTPTVLFAIISAARIAEQSGDWATAAILAHCSLAQQGTVGFELFPTDREVVDALVTEASRRLGPAEVERHRSIGETLPIEEAIAQASAVLESTAAHTSGAGTTTTQP